MLRRLAVANLVANVLIVLTGGAVRLTASGLGCPTWPRCTETSLVTTRELGVHGYVEFGNRLLTFALAAVAVATVVAAVTTRARRDVRLLSLAVLLGIPLQAVIGGITVLTDLNPWVVMLHFLASMVLIAVATVLVHRTRGDAVPYAAVPPAARRLAWAVAATLAAVLYVGAVVTGSGPHAGDLDARRTGLDPGVLAQVHADLVFLLVGLTVGLLVTLQAVRAPHAVRRAAAVLLAAELAQGVVGYVQYALALPRGLVAVHMVGAALLVVAATSLTVVMTAGARPPAPASPPLPRARPAREVTG